MTIDHTRLVAALRDTAAKALETREVPRVDHIAMLGETHFNRRENTVVVDHADAFSKEWIAGRLLGMADTLEALVSEV